MSFLLRFFLFAVTLFCTRGSFVSGAYVRETLVLTEEVGAPNGQPRDMIMINGQMPGPQLIFDENDDVEITVQNNMPQNATIHWHGLLYAMLPRKGTPWSDGVPGLSQKPIEPGQSFIYRFKAYPPGQYWYHSHSRSTLLDGLHGALFIRHKPDAPAPWSLISKEPDDIAAMSNAASSPHILVLSDWDQYTSTEYMKANEDSRVQIFCVDSILINGKGSVNCPGQPYITSIQSAFMNASWPNTTVSDKGCFPFVPKTQGPWLDQADLSRIPPRLQEGCVPSNGTHEVIEVDPADKWASINFVSASTFKVISAAIDAHEFYVYEVDGQYIEPQRVDTILAFAGERYSVMIKLDKDPADYPIRLPDGGFTQIIYSSATLRYKSNSSVPKLAYNGDYLNNATVLDVLNMPPFPSTITPSLTSDAMHLLDLGKANSSWRFTMSGKALYIQDRDAYTPLLYNPSLPDAFDPELVIRTQNGTWVDLVLQVGWDPRWPNDFPHAAHKHSNKFWQIGVGAGIWNYSSVDEAIKANASNFNLVNPPYRDTFMTAFGGPNWRVLRYQVMNPGAWLFHCHLEEHLASGMAVAILDGVDAWPEIPAEYGVDQKGHMPL
ncbi:multicopper oxidase [Xylona heveae TC161]|uniref:Multicopper oxidase n=1 Tax=Xylona heveae (strain CBS 132557 / TC161) TaxID=1328760 RepID=A0A164ZK89_XYLHT|nr:multicopper oxidase [Xylona heveae TC161]KZF19196.1 multicopper oxidase [Xylona heveae TC161]